MGKIKSVFLTICCSFTLVVIVNCLFSTIFVQNSPIIIQDVYRVLLTCILISLAINFTRIVESVLLSYLTMMGIIFLMQYIYYGLKIFQSINIMINVVVMTIVFLVVYVALYYVNEKDANKINHMIKNKREGSQYE